MLLQWISNIGKQFTYLYMVNIFTKFTLANFIKDQTPDTIIDTIVQMRIGSGLGSPKKILADNGGEFENERFRDMCENLNIHILNIAAESPWQNGVCERNHAVVDRCMEIILEDQPDIPLPKALYWAINAKNALQMLVLVFGRNPNIPYTLADNPPALKGTTINHSFTKYVHAIRSAISAFTEAESSEKVRRALRAKLRAQGVYSREIKFFT